MKALQIQRFGDPAQVLKIVDVQPGALRDGDVRVRIQAAGINPSDVANAQGAFPNTTLPRIIGRDYAGQIVEGPAELIGLDVWGSGGDLGFTRDGTHAETIDVPRDSVSIRPKALAPAEAAVVGVPFTTAYVSLHAANLSEGEVVIVTGAAGAVGSAAIELINAYGCTAIALVKDAAEESQLDKTKIKAIATSAAGNLSAVVHQATADRGADVALNGIGASIAPALLESLASGGRMAVYGAAMGGREIQLNLADLYRRRLQLTGINTSFVDAVKAAAILDELRPMFEIGALSRPRIAQRFTLDRFADAYNAVRSGKVVFQFAA